MIYCSPRLASISSHDLGLALATPPALTSGGGKQAAEADIRDALGAAADGRPGRGQDRARAAAETCRSRCRPSGTGSWRPPSAASCPSLSCSCPRSPASCCCGWTTAARSASWRRWRWGHCRRGRWWCSGDVMCMWGVVVMTGENLVIEGWFEWYKYSSLAQAMSW